MKHVMDC